MVKDYFVDTEREDSKRRLLIAEAVHAAVWIVCKFSPMFGAKMLGGTIGLAVAAVILVLVYE